MRENRTVASVFAEAGAPADLVAMVVSYGTDWRAAWFDHDIHMLLYYIALTLRVDGGLLDRAFHESYATMRAALPSWSRADTPDIEVDDQSAVRREVARLSQDGLVGSALVSAFKDSREGRLLASRLRPSIPIASEDELTHAVKLAADKFREIIDFEILDLPK